ncbi:YlbF family regulator [Bacillus sp. 31A1R]|uniref:YlbF family regulator n=1 Tax=Robertmurraya mangrovi TaxID=3098077 RepID=A0ABU5IU37_9BACI|nr:YlbF family regulator [Bacillus sp. 31A1R]MDZ5470670.1 YlbF family regulator [Bacillus sp. 31A1R]
MLATSERIEILDQAEELANMILQSDIAEYYRFCLNKLSEQDTQRKISAFVKAKEQYEEVQRFGRYHPDYKKIMMDIRELKREMDLDLNVAEFKRAENELQELLDKVSVIIGHSVSEHIKVPTGNPFFESSCGGGCSTGGSCGCS